MKTSSIIVTHTINDGSLTDNCEKTGLVTVRDQYNYRINVLTNNSEEAGMMTRGMVRNRAVALAVINGRLPQEVSKADWEEAKLGLTAKPGK